MKLTDFLLSTDPKELGIEIYEKLDEGDGAELYRAVQRLERYEERNHEKEKDREILDSIYNR